MSSAEILTQHAKRYVTKHPSNLWEKIRKGSIRIKLLLIEWDLLNINLFPY